MNHALPPLALWLCGRPASAELERDGMWRQGMAAGEAPSTKAADSGRRMAAAGEGMGLIAVEKKDFSWSLP